MRTLRPLVSVALFAVAIAAPSGAEIYRWTDAGGRVHFTEDLGSVPADQRGAARAQAAAPAESRVQGYATPPAARAVLASPRTSGASASRTHRVQVERAGNGMIVPVRLNGQTTAPFLIDTGASYVLVPARVAKDAGIDVGAATRTMRFSTANGVVDQALVMLDSVELGTARAEQVPAAVSDRMEIGLLGLSFFNRFTYQVDAANGVVTLVDNDLAESGQILGGRSETQWRGEFQGLRARMEEVEAARARTPSAHGRRLDRLDDVEQEIQRQLDELETEADQARVPDAWRY